MSIMQLKRRLKVRGANIMHLQMRVLLGSFEFGNEKTVGDLFRIMQSHNRSDVRVIEA